MRIWLQSHGAVTQMSAVIRMEIDSEAPIRGEIQEAGAQWSDCLQRIAQSADLKAYQSLFSHFAPLIKAFACRVPSLQEPETFAEDLVQERNRQQIHDSLQSLPAEQADILRRVYLEDKSHAEVAGELDLPLGTVKSRVRLALNKLRLLIDR